MNQKTSEEISKVLSDVRAIITLTEEYEKSLSEHKAVIRPTIHYDVTTAIFDKMKNYLDIADLQVHTARDFSRFFFMDATETISIIIAEEVK